MDRVAVDKVACDQVVPVIITVWPRIEVEGIIIPPCACNDVIVECTPSTVIDPEAVFTVRYCIAHNVGIIPINEEVLSQVVKHIVFEYEIVAI